LRWEEVGGGGTSLAGSVSATQVSLRDEMVLSRSGAVPGAAIITAVRREAWLAGVAGWRGKGNT